MLAGANDLIAIFRWGRRLKPEAFAIVWDRERQSPRHAACHYLFQALDADGLSRTLDSLEIACLVTSLSAAEAD